MSVAPLKQAGDDVVFIGINQRAGRQHGREERPDGLLLNVIQHPDHHVPSTFGHHRDWRFSFTKEPRPGPPLSRRWT